MDNEAKESAVSEVVGIILMVALTVFMAAIIAAYASGMMQGVPLTRSVIVTVAQSDPSHISVTYRGGPDNALLEILTIIWPDGTPQTCQPEDWCSLYRDQWHFRAKERDPGKRSYCGDRALQE